MQLDDSQPRSQFKPSGGALTVATGAGGAETSLLVWRVADRTLELEQAVLLGSVSKGTNGVPTPTDKLKGGKKNKNLIEPFKAAIEFPAPLVPSVTWFATPQGLVAIAAAGSLIFRLFFVADSTVEAVLSSGRQASWYVFYDNQCVTFFFFSFFFRSLHQGARSLASSGTYELCRCMATRMLPRWLSDAPTASC